MEKMRRVWNLEFQLFGGNPRSENFVQGSDVKTISNHSEGFSGEVLGTLHFNEEKNELSICSE